MSNFGGIPTPDSPFWLDWNLSYSGGAFGAIFGGHSVQIAVVNTLKIWYPAYVKEVNRQLGGDVLPIVKEYQRPYTDRPWAPGLDVQINCIVPGTVKAPERTSYGYRSCWKANLEIFVFAGEDWQECLALTYAYAATARACIIQHADLGGFAETSNWTGESYGRGPENGLRYSGVANVDFDVNIFNTVDQFAGPPSPEYAAEGTPTLPSLLPLPDFPTVVDTYVEIENQSQANQNGAPSPI